eukprot:superscaffoldBa00001187_g9417
MTVVRGFRVIRKWALLQQRDTAEGNRHRVLLRGELRPKSCVSALFCLHKSERVTGEEHDPNTVTSFQPAVRCGGAVCAGQRRAGLQGGLEWPLHDQPGRHSGSRGAFVSQSNLATSSLPSIHLSQCFLSACVPAAASHVTIEPGLDGCCSESRESPIWTTGETEERREVDSN